VDTRTALPQPPSSDQRGNPHRAQPRILLYSHDSFGLGHLRRNLNIAQALGRAFPDAATLLVTGSPCATFFPTPAGVELVKLPSVSKDASGAYVSRKLPLSLASTLHLRKGILKEVFRTFAPDLLIVDHQMVGLHGEMLPVLKAARRNGTRTILGVRDVIDSPEAVAREWGGYDCRWALTQAYDRVCVYGVPEVFDPRREYPVPPELGERLEFTGYVVREPAVRPRRPVPSLRRRVLVTMGGGEDGAQRVDAYLHALEEGRPDWESVVVAGPLMDDRQVRRLRRRAMRSGVRIHRSRADLPRQLAACDAVVSMAGYNTCAENLASGKPSVLLPRSRPRLEQAIRAQRLAQLDLAITLDQPSAAELVDGVEEALSHATTNGRPRPPVPDLGGTYRLCEVVADLLSISPDAEAPIRSLVS
jgi:predicted glycosyltransferase